MPKVTVAPGKDTFLKDGRPFFYFADTAWSAFSNTPLHEWEEYLDYRSKQGYNTLQISILPILHDTSDAYVGVYPFETKENGEWDFHRIDEGFFERAEHMVRMASQKGFTCALGVLWAIYVKDTNASEKFGSHIMPFDAVKLFVAYVAKRFAPYDPIYLISGDTNFKSDTAVSYYMTALETIKEIDPGSLASLHLAPAVEMPQAFVDSKLIDFYMYQTGHSLEAWSNNYMLANSFLESPVKRPIVNGEPCYEGHGHSNRYGRHNAFSMRRAFWQSVLAGAKAGFTYGSHGIFSWHRRGAAFTSEPRSKIPFHWDTAMRLQGSWDCSYSKWLFERYRLHGLEPANGRLITELEGIMMAETPDSRRIALYVPYNIRVKIKGDLSGYKGLCMDLAGRNVIQAEIDCGKQFSEICMHDENTDVLYILEK